MFYVTDAIQLDEREIAFRFVRSPGPGGQHVNKTATGVQLRFDLANSTSLPEDVRDRLQKKAHNRINSQGVLLIEANRFRSQDLNRKDALERLKELIIEATRRTKSRHKTKPTFASIRKRLENKKRRGGLKHTRRTLGWPGE